MASLYNLVRVLTGTFGTGTIALGPSVQGFLTFPQGGVPDGAVVSYGIRDGANSEVGTGTYNAGTLTRSVVNSTNVGALINLSGSAEVYITALAQDITNNVQKTGDQMTGNLLISPGNLGVTNTDPTIYINKSNVADSGSIFWQTQGNITWQLVSEGTADDIYFARYTTAGPPTDAPITIRRTTGVVEFSTEISVSKLSGTGAIRFTNDPTNVYISYNGNWNMVGGGLYVSSGVIGSSGTTILTSNASPIYLRPWGAASAVSQAYLDTNGNFALNGTNASFYPPGGVNGGFITKLGDTNAIGPSYFNIYNNSGQISLYLDNTWIGNFTFASDYRIKKGVTPLPIMWDTVKALKPIKYTQAEFTAPLQRANNLKNAADRAALTKDEVPPPAPLFPADNIERWGFIAHELQETMIESAATGSKDMPNGVQSPNPFTLIAALTKALQEAMVRIEALEAAAAG